MVAGCLRGLSLEQAACQAMAAALITLQHRDAVRSDSSLMWIPSACYEKSVIRRILTYPDPTLKQKATDVPNIDGALVETIDDMVETMYDAPGVGLAAPQIGLSQRVIVLDVDHENKTKNLLKN